MVAQSYNSSTNEEVGASCLKIDKEMVRKHLVTSNECKSPGLDKCHHELLKELGDMILKLLYVVLEKS